MTEDAARAYGGDITFEDMQIRSADGRLDYPYDGIAGRLQLWFRPLLEPLLAGSTVDDRSHRRARGCS